MIGKLRGVIDSYGEDSVVVDVHGVGETAVLVGQGPSVESGPEDVLGRALLVVRLPHEYDTASLGWAEL